MKIVKSEKIKETVAKLCLEANFNLRPDVLKALKLAYRIETDKRAKKILKATIDNAGIAREEKLAICQDTGIPVVFVELGQDVHITDGLLDDAINKGVESGYKKGFLRNSIVSDPVLRGGSGYSPTVIHTEIVKGSRIKLTVLPKGFGCENKGQVRMFKPTADIKEVKNFLIDVVRQTGPDACPPFVIGIGIGGTQDYACLLAKKALLKKVKSQKSKVPSLARTGKSLEQELLNKINQLNIGPMGLGGKTTALGVNIETHPTHIAGLPVAINISCHALRGASAIL